MQKVSLLVLIISALSFYACSDNSETQTQEETVSAKTKLLIFSKTNGYRHESIAAGQDALRKIAIEQDYELSFSEDSTQFTSDNLKEYAAVVFLNTTGDVLGAAEEKAFEDYIISGGGFVGIHSAADTEYDWEFYNQLVGAYFDSHPNDPNVREALIKCQNKNHASTKHLPNEWTRSDEWYNYKSIQPNLKVLLELDETSYEGGTNGDFHPIAWYHEQGQGRAFYTGGGHTDASYAEPMFLEHLKGGLVYAIGE